MLHKSKSIVTKVKIKSNNRTTKNKNKKPKKKLTRMSEKVEKTKREKKGN